MTEGKSSVFEGVVLMEQKGTPEQVSRIQL